MKKMNAAAGTRLHRNPASEADWQQWISRPAAEPSLAPNDRPAPRNGHLQPSREAIARLAYALWEQRGCPNGSPEEDWLRAEQQLLNPSD